MDERGVKKSADMRWQRTERHLMAEFGRALAALPIEKITVTELARAAEINKATFYLHYRDIYDLSEAYARALANRVVDELGEDLSLFFTDPRAFVAALVGVLSADDRRSIADALGRNKLIPQFMDGLTARLDAEFQRLKPAPAGAEPEIMVSFFVHGLLGALIQHADVERAVLVQTMGDLLVALGAHGRAMAEVQATQRARKAQGAPGAQGMHDAAPAAPQKSS